jgi:hypothetical protein
MRARGFCGPGRWSRSAPILCAFALAIAACSESLERVPPELLGVWKTRDGRHDRNFLEVRERELVLGVVGLELDVLSIEEIEATRVGGQPVYRLYYLADEGYRDSLALTWLEEQQAIRVGSSAETWTRSATR